MKVHLVDTESVRLPRILTSDMLDILMDEHTPYFCRRAMDKSCYEVGRQDNEDWREVITDDQHIIKRLADPDEAEDLRERLSWQWCWEQLIATAPK